MNLSTKTTGLAAVAKTEVDRTTEVCEAMETLSAAGYNLGELDRVVQNIYFAIDQIAKTNDITQVNALIGLTDSLESISVKVEGELTVESATEGVMDALANAWEAIKRWLTKVFTAVFNLIAAIFGAEGIKDTKEKIADIKGAAPDADVLAKAGYTGSQGDVSAEYIKGVSALEKEYLAKIAKLSEEKAAAAEAFQKELAGKVEMARLDEKVNGLKNLVDQSNELHTAYSTKMAELAAKSNATVNNNNNNNILAGLTPAILSGFATDHGAAMDPTGPVKKITESTKRVKKVVEEVEKKTPDPKKPKPSPEPTPKPPPSPSPAPTPPKPPTPSPTPTPPKPPAVDPVTKASMDVLSQLGKTVAQDMRVVRDTDKVTKGVWGTIKRGAGFIARKGWAGRNIKGNLKELAGAREATKTKVRNIMLWALRLFVIDADSSTISELAKKIGTETNVINAFISALRATGVKKEWDADAGEWKLIIPDDATAVKVSAALKISKTDVTKIVKEANKLPDPKEYNPEEH